MESVKYPFKNNSRDIFLKSNKNSPQKREIFNKFTLVRR